MLSPYRSIDGERWSRRSMICTPAPSRTRLGTAESSPYVEQQSFKAPLQHLLPRVETTAHPCTARTVCAGAGPINSCCLHLHFLTLNVRRVMGYNLLSCAVFVSYIPRFLLSALPVHALIVWILPYLYPS